MNKIYPILLCDCCCSKGIVRTCSLKNCDYRMCISCRNRYNNNLCPACRREIPIKKKKCYIVSNKYKYKIKYFIENILYLLCNIEDEIPFRNVRDTFLVFLKIILFFSRLTLFIAIIFTCRIVSAFEPNCRLINVCDQSFMCDNPLIFVLLCMYGFILGCVYCLFFYCTLMSVLICINRTCCPDYDIL